ncbi:MAG: tetratricopeptide repeat protein [SAR324 cluster bacterium]|nr:tetratricopeptide repeat protein [SAR324 cluster bacterium]
MTKKYEDLEKSYQNNPTDINLVEIARRQVLDLDFPSAIGSLDQALAEEEKTKETSKARRASIYYEKGKIANLQLEYQKAKDYFSKAVELAPQTFEYNMSFGNIMITIGDFGFAQKLYKDALLLAQDDKEKGDVLNNLGTIYLSTKEYDKVILNLEEALSLYSKTLAEDSPSIAATLDNLGLALKRNGKIDEAIVCHKKALAKFRESLGDEHPSTARAYNNFASALLIKEEFYKAAENYDRSLNIKLKLYGEDHPAVASTLSNLGAIYLTIGENRHALEMTEKALKIFAKHLPAGHSNIAGIQHNIEIIKAAIAAEK